MPLGHTLLLILMASCLITSSSEAAVASDDSSSTVFDVADAIAPVRDFPASFQPVDQGAALPASAPRSFCELRDDYLRRTFEPEVAEAIIAQSTMDGGKMRVTGTKALRDRIASALAQARVQSHLQVHTDVLEVLMDPTLRQERYALKELAWQELPSCPGLAFATLTQEQLLALQTRWTQEPGVSNPVHPSLTCFSGQLGNLSMRTTSTYPKLIFTASGPSIGLGSFEFGDVITVRATASLDRRFIHLVLRHERVGLLGMTSVNLGAKADAPGSTVEVPQLSSTQERIDVVMKEGSSVIIATSLYLEHDQQPRAGFLVLTSQILKGSDEQQGAQVAQPSTPVEPPIAAPRSGAAAKQTF